MDRQELVDDLMTKSRVRRWLLKALAVCKQNRLVAWAGIVWLFVLLFACMLLFSGGGSSELHKCVTVETVSGSASGFFIRFDGNLYVATCNHVVEDQPFVKVLDMEGVEHYAAAVYFCPDRDLAFIQLSESNQLHRSVFKIQPKVEQLDLSLPLYCLGDSEGKGVVVKSEGKVLGIGPTTIETDATIVPGNSGGPVILKQSGKVIGAASHLTNNSGRWKWTKGTRFDNAIRKFAVRLDNIKKDDVFGHPKELLRPDDYASIVEQAEKIGDPDLKYACFLYAAEHGNTRGQFLSARELLFAKKGFMNDDENRKRAIYWLQQAADQNDVGAIECLAGLYDLDSFGFTRNEERAFGLFLKAAKLGSASAMFKVGERYRQGAGVIKDDETGWAWIEKGASGGDINAMIEMGKRYHFGTGVAADAGSAEAWYNRALKTEPNMVGHPKGDLHYLIGLLHEMGGEGIQSDTTVALHHYEKAVNENLFFWNQEYKTDCLGRVALIRFNEATSPDQERRAFELLHAAAEAGSVPCQRLLADCYRLGKCVPINKEEAFSWNLKAAERGDADAQEQAGLDCESNPESMKRLVGLTRGRSGWNRYDNTRFREYTTKMFRLAAENGKPYSQWKLGELYYNGESVKQDFDTAFFWYKKAAEQEYVPAMLSLSLCYEKGHGCLINRALSIDWKRKAALKEQAETGSVPKAWDSDGDGIPDEAETSLGLNPLDPTDAAKDSDGDGFTNLEEFLAKTSPSDTTVHPPMFRFLRVSSINIQKFPFVLKSHMYTVTTKQLLFKFHRGNQSYMLFKGEKLADTDYILSDYQIKDEEVMVKGLGKRSTKRATVTLSSKKGKLVIKEGAPPIDMSTVSFVCIKDAERTIHSVQSGGVFEFDGDEFLLDGVDQKNGTATIINKTTGESLTVSKE